MAAGRDADRLFIVDCLLPGQLHRLGRNKSFITPRITVEVSVPECEIRGDEYVAYDRSNFAAFLKIWLPKAESGDPEDQTYLGEIFEKGLGQTADAMAAAWYFKAAELGYSRALINLGYLYESGLGVEMGLAKAIDLYWQSAGFTDGTPEYLTSVEIVSRNRQAAELPELHSDKLLSFRVNGVDQSVHEHGVFLHPASLDESSSVRLIAVNIAGERVAMEIMAHDQFVQIHTQLATAVTHQSTLQYALLEFAGHENGECMFVSADNRSCADTYPETLTYV